MKKQRGTFVENIRGLYSKPFFLIVFILSSLIIACTAILPAWQLLPDIQERIAIPLHYNIHFGVDLFGAWWRIFLVPLSGLVILLVNYASAIILWERERVLSYFLVSVALLIQILLFISMIFTVLFIQAYG